MATKQFAAFVGSVLIAGVASAQVTSTDVVASSFSNIDFFEVTFAGFDKDGNFVTLSENLGNQSSEVEGQLNGFNFDHTAEGRVYFMFDVDDVDQSTTATNTTTGSVADNGFGLNISADLFADAFSRVDSSPFPRAEAETTLTFTIVSEMDFEFDFTTPSTAGNGAFGFAQLVGTNIFGDQTIFSESTDISGSGSTGTLTGRLLPGDYTLRMRSTSIGIPGDTGSAFGTYDFTLVPAPGAASLAMLGGLTASRRRR
ncbi:MAG: hypothetical protein AAGD00_07710 [Planctomycetota bacterium]